MTMTEAFVTKHPAFFGMLYQNKDRVTGLVVAKRMNGLLASNVLDGGLGLNI